MTRNVQELLPFYVNGSLAGEERERVEQALRDDPALQGEVAYLKNLREEIKTQPQENSPGELGLKRLQKSLAAEKLKKDPLARAAAKIAPEQNNIWRITAIAACLLLLLQTVLVLPLIQEDDLIAASGPQAVYTEHITEHFIVSATFAPGAAEQDLRALLLEAGASIISGPSALGVYQLALPQQDAEAALDILRARPDLIESLDGPGGA